MADLVGIDLDEWSRAFLVDALGVTTTGQWAAFEVLLELARQNGKSWILDLIALTALYTWQLKTIVYSAHETTTAMEAFERIEGLIQATPALRAVTPDRCFTHGNGKEKIRLATGERILFKTRTSGGGRGLSGDLVICDEAQALKDTHIAALFPTLRAKPNPLIVYAGSAGDQTSTVLGRLIRRMTNMEPRLCGWRFAADEDDDPAAAATWAKVTPALGRRITVDYMAHEQRSLPPEKFARELLTIGDYPREDGEDWVIPQSRVERTTVDGSALAGRGVLAVDAHPAQEWASIAVAGPAGVQGGSGQVTASPGGGVHVEVIDHQRGVRWLGPRLVELLANHDVAREVVLDPKGPLGRMVPDLEDLGIRIRLLKAEDVAAACGWIYDGMVNDPSTVFHRGAPVLVSAISSAQTRQLLGGFAWRRAGQADISPLYAATFAGHAAATWAGKPARKAPRPRRVGPGQESTARRPDRRRRPARDVDVATTSF
jgi:rubredoxin